MAAASCDARDCFFFVFRPEAGLKWPIRLAPGVEVLVVPSEEEVRHEPENGHCNACPLKSLLPEARIGGEMVVKRDEDHHKVLHQDHHLNILNELWQDSGVKVWSPGREVEEGKCCVHGRCFEDCLHSC